MKVVLRRLMPAFAASLVAACDTRDTTPEAASLPADKSAGAPLASATAPSPEPPAPPPPPPPSVADGAADTLAPSLLPGRKRRDSVAFASTVAFGRRMVKRWPELASRRADALLPAKRIVAFYGNPLSKRMGVLGEYPPDEMLAKLDSVVREWERADPTTPVQPALHLIAVVAQGSAGKDGMWRARMDSSLIEKVYGWARSRNALLFLDVQVGKSTLQR